MEALVTRWDAKSRGERYYFTGVMCKHGHSAVRLVSNGACVPCNLRSAKQWSIANRERSRAIKSKSQKAHPEARIARFKRWVAKHPEDYRKALNDYKRRNMDYYRAIWRSKRARRRGAEGKHGLRDIRRIYASQDGKCVACKVGLERGYHVDHIVPIAKGGTNYPTNIQLLCPSCNLDKRDKDFHVWLDSRKDK